MLLNHINKNFSFSNIPLILFMFLDFI